MNKKLLAILIGAASAGAVAYGGSKYLRSKKKAADLKEENGEAQKLIEDSNIEKKPCPSCGKPVRSYEFFCPFCNHTFDKAG